MIKTPLTQTNHKAAVQTYRFEFGSDNKIYSISFKGAIQESEIRGILASVHNTLFEKCGGAIQSYLDSNHLSYSNFAVFEKKLGKGKTMEFADRMIHRSSCSIIDKWIKDTDVYFGIMDCLEWMKDCCAGCYCVVARMQSAQNGQYEYHAITQTFDYSGFSKEERSHFAIRKDNGEHNLITLDEEDRYPVLATFGCVDLLNLLINITDITTRQQAAGLANK